METGSLLDRRALVEKNRVKKSINVRSSQSVTFAQRCYELKSRNMHGNKKKRSSDDGGASAVAQLGLRGCRPRKFPGRPTACRRTLAMGYVHGSRVTGRDADGGNVQDRLVSRKRLSGNPLRPLSGGHYVRVFVTARC